MAKLRTNKKAEEVEIEVEEVKAEEVKPAKQTKVKKAEAAKVEKEDVEPVDVIDRAVKKSEELKDVQVEKGVKTEPNVRVCTNRDVRAHIGDRWYNIKAGKQVTVPRTVKEKLRKAGYLTAL